MKLRHKLLLLALIPLPLLLLLGLGTIRPLLLQHAEAQEAQSANQLFRRVDRVASSLLLERQASLDPDDRDGLLQRRRVVDEATSELLTYLDTARVPAPLQRQLQDWSTQLQGLPQRRAQIDSNSRASFRHRQFSSLVAPAADLRDRYAVYMQDPALTEWLRALAHLVRLTDAVLATQDFVSVAIDRGRLSAEIERALTASVAQENLERRLLTEVTINPQISAQLQDLFNNPNIALRQSVVDSATGYTGVSDELVQLNRALGYGGMLHHFKNYVLRHESRHREAVQSHGSAALMAIDRLRQNFPDAALDQTELQTVSDTIQAYLDALPRVDEAFDRGASIPEIDAAVKIDDQPALDALQVLAQWIPPLDTAYWGLLTEELASEMPRIQGQLQLDLENLAADTVSSTRNQLLVLVAGAGLVLLLTSLFTASVYRRLSGDIQRFLSQIRAAVASGDTSLQLDTSGQDELTEIQQAVQRQNQRLEELAALTRQVAQGNLATLPEPLSERDQLALSIRELGLSAREVVEQAEAIAEGDYSQQVKQRSDEDALARALNQMSKALRRFHADVARARWSNEGQLALLKVLSQSEDLDHIGRSLLRTLLRQLGATMGLVLVKRDEGLTVIGQAGLPADTAIHTRLQTDEGLVGRALQAEQTLLVDDLPPDYLRISSGLGDAPVRAVTVTGLRVGGEPVGAIELGWTQAPDERAIAFLDLAAESLAIGLDAELARERTEELLAETQRQAGRLEEQQEALRSSNEELEEQTQALRQSEEELKSQREELQTTNEELEERGEALERQRTQLEKVAEDLRTATRYKSEFLANMSHELRTPLNSMLILAAQFARNEDGNLSEDQQQSARVIHDSGKDLLELINEILDLSKIEAGQMRIQPETVRLEPLIGELLRQFQAQASNKQLALNFHQDAALSASITTDRQRLTQILRNLISNALKFTAKGEVSVHFEPAPSVDSPDLMQVRVCDSGIGIAADKLEEIFEPFIQADGSTSRKYGGTGLGLSICRELAKLLGGHISARSETGKGSEFTLVISTTLSGERRSAAAELPTASAPAPEVPARVQPSASTPAESGGQAEPSLIEQVIDDDRDHCEIGQGILIIEDDLRFAALMRDLVRRRGRRALVAADGSSGLQLAEQWRPAGIILDLRLPDLDGLRVLDALKQSLQTRHIPVHVISASDPSTEALQRGAIGFLSKPAEADDLLAVLASIERKQTQQRRILVVEDDDASRQAITSLLVNDHTDIITTGSGEDALQRITAESFDCVVLDLGLQDIDGFELLRRLHAEGDNEPPPVVVYTGRELSREQHKELSELAQSVVVKGAESPERLLDEVTLFVHALNEQLPSHQRAVLERIHSGKALFEGRQLLLVDDDLRNSFALSGVLKKQGFEVHIADNGELALERLRQAPDTDIVLMDIMMPVMDGYETMRAMRADPALAEIPVIALTAKAMPEDRRRCIEAGANDYLGKPVELDRLLAMIRLWLSRA